MIVAEFFDIEFLQQIALFPDNGSVPIFCSPEKK